MAVTSLLSWDTMTGSPRGLALLSCSNKLQLITLEKFCLLQLVLPCCGQARPGTHMAAPEAWHPHSYCISLDQLHGACRRVGLAVGLGWCPLLVTEAGLWQSQSSSARQECSGFGFCVHTVKSGAVWPLPCGFPQQSTAVLKIIPLKL